MFKVQSKWPHQDSIKIEWNIGKRCNLDCKYCPAEIHDNYSPHTDAKIMYNTINTLHDLNKPIRLSFTGGEPCVHPNIEEIINYAHQKINWINITTNGLRTPEWYEKQPVSHYVFSLHFDNNHWKRAIDNITYYAQLNKSNKCTPFHVNVMAHHEYMDRVKIAVTQFRDHNILYTIRRIRWTEAHDQFDDTKYDTADLLWILDQETTALANCVIDNEKEIHANDIIKNHMNQFEGWRCAAGVESLMINWDGEVHRATCRVGGSLGNIYNGNFKAPKEWVTCTRRWCTCAADIPLSKSKNI